MFEARIVHCEHFKGIIEALKCIFENLTISITEKGFYCNQKDAPGVCMIAMKLKKSGFDYYECTKPLDIHLNLNRYQQSHLLINITDYIKLIIYFSFSKIFKYIANEDSLKLSVDDECTVLTCVVKSKKRNCTCEYNLRLLNIDCERMDISVHINIYIL